MRPEDYAREYLAPLPTLGESATEDSSAALSQGVVRSISYSHAVGDTLAGLSKEELLLLLGEELKLDLEPWMSTAALRAALKGPLSRAEVLQRELNVTRGGLEQTRHQLERLQTSRSWRLTRPLRHWANRLRRLSRAS